MYPSSIAAYGFTSLEAKTKAGRVREDDWNAPTTMYGCNKLYCEHLGRYYAGHYKQLAVETLSGKVDFRCVRFPGLISAITVPSGGTSDYAPEMLHAAAQGKPTTASCGPTPGFPSWPCPTVSKRCWRWLAQGPADPRRLQRRVLQPLGRPGPRSGPRGVPAGQDRLRPRPEAPAHRRLLAG
jgi:hypothetical protein